jgi:superfamily II DNA/RNA helicase
LSYGLPILQWLLENDDGGNDDNEDTEGCGSKQNEVKERLPLQALILVPTREVSPMTFDKSYAIASSNNHPNLSDLLACYSSDQRTHPCLFK